MQWRTAPAALLIAMAAAVLVAEGGGAPAPIIPAQGRSQGADAPPVFRGGVTIVEIDAFVTDAMGKPVTGLTAEDFEVIEAGKPGRISTFAAVDLPVDPPLGTPSEAEGEPDVATNTRPRGRTYVFALDEVSQDRALRARHFLRQFIDENLGPHDRAAVVLTGRGLADSGQDFTDNRRLLLRAIDKFSGGFDAPREECGSGSDARQLAASLRRLTEFMATLPGRKVLVYVGEALGNLDFYELQSYRGGVLSMAMTDAHAALAAATRGNVTVYPVDPCGLSLAGGGVSELDRRMDLTALAEVTGGFAVTNTNNFTGAFERIVRENSTYYTIGFDSGYTRQDGRFVRVDVHVKRPGLQVRTRGGYLAPTREERAPGRVMADTRLPAIADALASAVATPGLPLRVFAAPYRGTRAKEVAVAVAVEIDVSTLALVKKNGVLTGPIEVTYLATDSRGKMRPGRRHAATLAIKPEAVERTFADGVRLLSEFTLPPGRYQLRVAAGTATTAGGVIYDLEVPDFAKGALTMSGVFLTSDHAAGVTTLRPVDPLAGALPGPPTARRDFARDETLGLFVEVYENTPEKARPHTITLTASLRGETGDVVPLATERRPSLAPGKPGLYRFTARVPLAAVVPGGYVLAVEAQSDLGEGTAIIRRVPIRVP